MRASARSPAAGRAYTQPRLVAEPARTSESCTSTPASPTRWARRSTTPKEFKSLDLDAVIKDLARADDRFAGLVAGRLRPLRRRCSSAWPGTAPAPIASATAAAAPARGQQRFAPLNSWPDNVNLDKARRLLWPIKQKYGRKISWADLMILAGNVALESMGFKTFGFGGGREDVWEPDEDIYWGAEGKWLGDERYTGDRDLREPARRRADGPDLRQPGGPERQSRSARGGPRHPRDLRPHGDERRGDGGADRRRPHLRQDPRRGRRRRCVGPEPEAAPIEEQGLGWKSSFGTGKGGDAITSGLEVAWTHDADQVGQQLLREPVRLRMGADQEPGRRPPVEAEGRRRRGTVPDAHDPSKRHAPTMLTTDLSLRFDPAYEKISRRFHEHPEQFADAFARAWFKLTHRDMGPLARYLGPLVPGGGAALAGPDPRGRSPAGRRGGHRRAEGEDPRLGPVDLRSWSRPPGPRPRPSAAPTSAAAPTARASAWRRRRTGRSTSRPSSRRCCGRWRRSSRTFNASQTGGKKVSLADLIVLGGCAAVEQAAKEAGHDVTVPFTPGRTDASQEQTDVAVVRRARAEGRRVPQLPARGRPHRVGRGAAGRPRAAADADRARDDGAGRRPARAGRQRRRVEARRVHRRGRAR